MTNTNGIIRVIKGLTPIVLFILGLTYFAYCRITSYTPIKLPSLEEMKSYGPILLPFIYAFSYLVRAGAALLFAFVLAGFISELMPKHVLLNHLSSRRKSSYFLAALFSPLLTVCSCVMVPVFAGLVYGGAGLGPALAFLLTAPAANIMAIIFTADIISWKIAIARLFFSIIIAVTVGFIISKMPWGKAVEEKSRARIRKGYGVAEQKEPLLDKLWQSFQTTCFLARTILPYLLLGIAIVSYVQAYLPPKIVATYLSGFIGIMLGAVIGVPMYTPTLVEVVLVDGLRHLGMSPSAALAFLIGGPMTSIPSMFGVSRVVGWKVILSYAVLAVVGAVIAGLCYYIVLGDVW